MANTLTAGVEVALELVTAIRPLLCSKGKRVVDYCCMQSLGSWCAYTHVANLYNYSGHIWASEM